MEQDSAKQESTLKQPATRIGGIAHNLIETLMGTNFHQNPTEAVLFCLVYLNLS